jgi:regulator of sigma E protease
VVVRDGKEQKYNIEFDMEEYEGRQYVKMDFWIRGVEKTFGNVLAQTGKEFLSYARMVFLSVHDIIAGKYGLSDISGPVGAVSVVSDSVKTSALSALRIMALLTINIGIFNLFPIPALPQKLEYAINAGGLVVLLGLMTVVTFSDISKFFK